jgi:hypothetical protein
MAQSNLNRERRRALKLAATAVATVPLSSLLAGTKARAGDLPQLSEDDSTAQALKYVHDASKAPADKRRDGTFCKNCNLIQGQEGEWRGCSLFPGKAVNENGWCLGWVGRV